MKSIFVATPMYGGMASGIYNKSLLKTFLYLTEKGYKLQYADLYNESLITRARNALTHLFLKSECEYLLFIDADQSFLPEDVERMVEANKDVIAAPVPMKQINWAGIKEAIENNKEDFESYGAYYNVNSFENNPTANIDEPFEVKHAGSGMMLIHRSVFEKISNLVGSYVSDSIAMGGFPLGEEVKEYWTTSIDPESNRLLSEDYNFCKLFRQKNGKIYLDLKAKVTHVGSYFFSGKVYG
jgi:hypothetical protein